jgi:hypothetical protein
MILENILNWCSEKSCYGNLTAGFSYSLVCTFGCGEFYDGGPRVTLPPMKWSATAESLRNTALQSCIQKVQGLNLSLVTGYLD